MNGSLEGARPGLSLVIGGARSGKSSLAERLATCLAGGTGGLHVIATATPGDAEMADRIARHRADRAASGRQWTVHEAPRDLPETVRSLRAGDVAVIDCLTLWLTNVMLAVPDMAAVDAIDAAMDGCVAALADTTACVVVVSNEVGWGIVPDNALARAFRDAQGRLNAQVAARADLVVGVMAGLPFTLKGSLPDGI